MTRRIYCIEIELEGAAFEGDQASADEVNAILRDLVEHQPCALVNTKLRDTNGNTVGRAWVDDGQKLARVRELLSYRHKLPRGDEAANILEQACHAFHEWEKQVGRAWVEERDDGSE